jgi:hypothetical protein
MDAFSYEHGEIFTFSQEKGTVANAVRICLVRETPTGDCKRQKKAK